MLEIYIRIIMPMTSRICYSAADVDCTQLTQSYMYMYVLYIIDCSWNVSGKPRRYLWS